MSVVMGTAGHIDHGKTSLVKRLTGADCDRLDEEKRRGITIELGFAPLKLPTGKILSIIDVPGHERFVRNMVAGAAGIDFVMLIVAADEGVMPQTKEHIEICSLLGVRHGLVVLTKIDMVDDEMVLLAQEDVREFLTGTFLENAPLFSVSSATGEGIDTLIEELAKMEGALSPERRTDLFRLPVDRIFTLKGHGTVVTGTLISGTVSIGDDIVIFPKAINTKVRGLQSHGSTCETAMAGRRTAVNLQGIEVESIERGDVLARPGTLFPSDRWIIQITCLSTSSRALTHRSEVHFHHGSQEMQARLYFFDRDRLLPGEVAMCEVRFANPYAAVFGDRVVVRSFSPLRTVAGGVVIHPLGATMRKNSALFDKNFELLEEIARTFIDSSNTTSQSENDALEEKRLQKVLEIAGVAGVTFSKLGVLTDLSSKKLEKMLGLSASRQQVFCFDKEAKAYIHGIYVEALESGCLAFMQGFHTKSPMQQGIGRGALLSGWGGKLAPRVVHMVLEKLLKSGRICSNGELLYLPDHRVSLAFDQTLLRRKLLEAYTKAGITPPNMKDVLEELKVTHKEVAPLLRVMQDNSELVRVSDAIWYGYDEFESIKAQVFEWFTSHDNLDLAGLKEITGLSRKYLIALLEYFDREKITVRIGDNRILR